jgi:hypothetical protein
MICACAILKVPKEFGKFGSAPAHEMREVITPFDFSRSFYTCALEIKRLDPPSKILADHLFYMQLDI